jgi:hypothetical protein
MWERTFTINGFSKAYAMTGWRLGYLVANQKLISAAKRVHQYTVTCANSFAQYGAVAALTGPQTSVEKMVAEFDRRRRLIVGGLESIGAFGCARPRGAFYLFPDISYYFGKSDGKTMISNSNDLCMYILNKVYVASSGETGACDWKADWLSATPASGTVSAGGTASLTAGVNASAVSEGVHNGYLRVGNSSPYGSVIVPVTEFKQRWGKRIAVLGGIDVDILTRGTQDDVRQATQRVLETCAPDGGYACGSGNSVPNYVPAANYLAMVRAAAGETDYKAAVEAGDRGLAHVPGLRRLNWNWNAIARKRATLDLARRFC